jgi:predicted acyltransferase
MTEPLPELPSLAPQEPPASAPATPLKLKPLFTAETLAVNPLPELASLPEPEPYFSTLPEPDLPPAPIAEPQPLFVAQPISQPQLPQPSPTRFELPISASFLEAKSFAPLPEPAPLPVVTEATAPKPTAQRLVSLDAYRGFIMLLMASGGLGIASLAKSQPGSVWAQIAPYLQHVEWIGCAPWDLIQPAFMFMVGVAMAFSLAKREARGQGFATQLFHAVLRAVILVALGVLLSTTVTSPQTNWIFTNVLAQIGLGYVFLFLLSRYNNTTVVLSTAFLLMCYWLWFAVNSPPRPDFPLASIGATAQDMLPHPFTPWSKHINAAADLDRLLLNALPRKELFAFNPGGYQTFNFIPSIATMVFGLLCGRLLRGPRSDWAKVGRLVLSGVLLTAAGWAAGEYLCPLVKRIWTPSWVLFSGGIVILMLSAFYVAIEMLGLRKLAMPLAIVGMNSIFVYLGYQLCSGWIKATLKVHLGAQIFDGEFGPMIESGSVLAVLWLLCWWLYRRRAFLSI